MFLKQTILFILLTVGFQLGKASNEFLNDDNLVFNFRYLSSSDGLSQDLANSICQDSSGFIWIATMNGLNKFDSWNFENYYRKLNGRNSLNSSNIRDIKLNKAGNALYIATSDGLNKMDLLTGKIKSIVPESLSIGKNSCYALELDTFNNIWLGTWESKLAYVNTKNDSIYEVPCKHDGNAETITDLFCDENNGLWIGTRGGGVMYMPEIGKPVVQYYDSGIPLKSLSSNFVTKIFKDSKDRLLVLTYKGIDVFDQKTKSFKQLEPANRKNNRVLKDIVCNSIIEDKNHFYWLGTDKGLFIINPNLDKYVRVNFNSGGTNHENKSVQNLFLDNMQNIWICTHTGIYIYSPYINQFHEEKQIVPVKSDPSSQLLFSHTTLMEAADKSIWIAQDHQYVNYNPFTRKYRVYSPEEIKTRLPEDVSVRDSKGNCLIKLPGNNGLVYFKKGHKKGIHLTYNANDNNSLPSNEVTRVFVDSHQRFWVLTNSSGVCLFNPETFTFTRFRHDPGDITSLTNDWVFNIYEDKQQNIWITSWHGISKYNTENKSFTRYLYARFPIVFSVHSQNNKMWLGTTNGLVLFNPDRDSIENHFDRSNGLQDNTVNSILADKNGNLWLGTPKGISRFNTKNHSVVNFAEEEGLNGKDFLHEAFLQTSNGYFYFGAVNGLYYFHPDSIKVNPFAPKIAITAFNVFNKPVSEFNDIQLTTNISYSKGISLYHNHNYFSIGYTALNYIHPEKCRYQYKLAGFDENWIEVAHPRLVIYTNLPYGKYSFMVKASNNQGVWSEQSTKLDITLNPPFWKTIWFKVLLIFLAGGIIILFFNLKTYLMRKRQYELEAQVKARTSELVERQKYIEDQAKELSRANIRLSDSNAMKDKIFSIIAHDLKNPFNSILGFTGLIKRNFEQMTNEKIKTYNETIHASALNLNKLLENLLQWSRTQANPIGFNPETFNLLDHTKETLLEVDLELQQKNINVNLDILKNMQVKADINMFKVIVRNLLTNAIKFSGPNGAIKIAAMKEGKKVIVEIRDNGVGIPETSFKKLFKVDSPISTNGTNNEKGTGLGLIICKEFVEKHGGEIWAESKVGVGSSFYFNLPVL